MWRSRSPLRMSSARASWSSRGVPRSARRFASTTGSSRWGGSASQPRRRAGGEGLAGGAGVDDVVRIEALHRADGLAVVAVLAVVVVFDDEGVAVRGPRDEGRAAAGGERRAERALVCGREGDGVGADVVGPSAVLVDGQRLDVQSRRADGRAVVGQAGVLEGHADVPAGAKSVTDQAESLGVTAADHEVLGTSEHPACTAEVARQ